MVQTRRSLNQPASTFTSPSIDGVNPCTPSSRKSQCTSLVCSLRSNHFRSVYIHLARPILPQRHHRQQLWPSDFIHIHLSGITHESWEALYVLDNPRGHPLCIPIGLAHLCVLSWSLFLPCDKYSPPRSMYGVMPPIRPPKFLGAVMWPLVKTCESLIYYTDLSISCATS